MSDLPFGLPAVVKPGGEGSSVGVQIVRSADHLTAACEDAAKYKGEILVEQYVAGREVQVAVLDCKALVPKIAAGNGISFPELCERLLEGASLKA